MADPVDPLATTVCRHLH